jgi:hypothetical protein
MGSSLTALFYQCGRGLSQGVWPHKSRGRRGLNGEGQQRIFPLGGQHNPLKRLISDKENKGNPSLFLGTIWLELGLAWPGFD